MSKIIVFLEHSNGEIEKASLSAITAATELKGAWSASELLGVVLGAGAKAAAGDAAKYGLDGVLCSEDGALENYLSGTYADALAEICEQEGANTVVVAATTTGKDFAPRLTALLGAAQASDILGVNDSGTLQRPMYAGDIIAEVELLNEKRVVTVRGTSFEPASEGGSADVRDVSLNISADGHGSFVGLEGSGGDRPDLTSADMVVSGGRAMQSSENFEKYIYPLADALGAAVGASRAAVDSGYAPNDWQVGQTGKVVAPQLYIAIGISGAIQHLAGMKDSKTIVAINKDPDAPIFEIADFGLVADLYEVVPDLTKKVKAAKG